MVDESSSGVATATFTGVPESVRAARHFVLDALAEEADDLATEVALLTSELATNAVIHAQTDFIVHVRRDGVTIRVEVVDGSTATARRCRYSATSGTGRGLGMVEDVSDDWGVEADGGGKRVWFSLRSDRRVRFGDETEAAWSEGAEPDLDAILADLGGWDDDAAATAEAALRRAG